MQKYNKIKIGNIIGNVRNKKDFFTYFDYIDASVPNLIIGEHLLESFGVMSTFSDRFKDSIISWTFEKKDYPDFKGDVSVFEQKCITKFLESFKTVIAFEPLKSVTKIGKVGYYHIDNEVYCVDLDLLDCKGIPYKIKKEIINCGYLTNVATYLIGLLN